MMMGQNEDDEQLKAINARYGFDKPVIHQYFFYLNDISPISIHSNNNSDFNYLDSNKYSYINILEVGGSVFVLKFPYFRESIKEEGRRFQISLPIHFLTQQSLQLLQYYLQQFLD